MHKNPLIFNGFFLVCLGAGVPDRCPIFYGSPPLKLSSHLAKSRHGVFYFRLTLRVGATTKERRLSLRTKNPQEARFKALYLSGIMALRRQEQQASLARDCLDIAHNIAGQTPEEVARLDLVRQTYEDSLADLSGLSKPKMNDFFDFSSNIRTFDIEVRRDGVAVRNIKKGDDVLQIAQLIRELDRTQTSLVKSTSPRQAEASLSGTPTEEGGATIQEMVSKFATRKKNKLTEKTLYEYANYHKKFVTWLEVRKNKKHIPVHTVSRLDVADFIDYLIKENIGLRTIKQKYLAALNGLFELAQTMGYIPEGQTLVSRGHKVFTKNDIKKSRQSSGFKPFTGDELKAIFQPRLLNEAQRPSDFWLPMLGLFTGGRISELAQLDISDIQKCDGIWAISINSDGDKSLKTRASTRSIPIHTTLLECGFLEYVKDAKVHGTKLFPYLAPDVFGSYGGTPSARWGKYLDNLGIQDRQKVFHSFRSTSNDKLKQNGVPEETRCQFIGHEYDTINSAVYSRPHDLHYLMENVACKLEYPEIDFKALRYESGFFSEKLKRLCALKARREKHKKLMASRK